MNKLSEFIEIAVSEKLIDEWSGGFPPRNPSLTTQMEGERLVKQAIAEHFTNQVLTYEVCQQLWNDDI